MIFIITLSILLILLISHLIILPISKKRPIFIKGFEGSLLVMSLFAVIAVMIHPLLFILALVLAVFIYYTKSWIVYGVSTENINSALDRAILASRTPSLKVNGGYEIDNSLFVKISNFGMRVCYIKYKNKSSSKKAELTKEIFRKFIQNYLI